MEFPPQKHLYIYNKQHKRIKEDYHSFYFFGSGSSGNSVYLKESHLLIDLGFPFKKYSDLSETFWYDVRYVLLTHEHTDHLNESTLYHLLEVYPHLKFLISKRMFNAITSVMFYKRWNNNKTRATKIQNELKNKYFQRFIIMDADTKQINLYDHDLTIHPVTIIPHVVSHGQITNIAYEIITPKLHVLYSSDLDHVFTPDPAHRNSIDQSLNLPLEYDASGHVKIFEHPFDLIFLEANYDADYLKKFLTLHPDDAHARGNLRHISEQETWQYIQYALKDTGTFIPLHASESFGTLVQDLKE